ncbi:hypothetical protein THAOC_19322, partial [Thalassiosira oceanica]
MLAGSLTFPVGGHRPAPTERWSTVARRIAIPCRCCTVCARGPLLTRSTSAERTLRVAGQEGKSITLADMITSIHWMKLEAGSWQVILSNIWHVLNRHCSEGDVASPKPVAGLLVKDALGVIMQPLVDQRKRPAQAHGSLGEANVDGLDRRPQRLEDREQYRVADDVRQQHRLEEAPVRQRVGRQRVTVGRERRPEDRDDRPRGQVADARRHVRRDVVVYYALDAGQLHERRDVVRRPAVALEVEGDVAHGEVGVAPYEGPDGRVDPAPVRGEAAAETGAGRRRGRPPAAPDVHAPEARGALPGAGSAGARTGRARRCCDTRDQRLWA